VNTEKALESMGGIDKMNKLANEHVKFLGVNYRPDDPFSHPLYADCVPNKTQFLIKLRKRTTGEEPAVQADSRTNHAHSPVHGLGRLPTADQIWS